MSEPLAPGNDSRWWSLHDLHPGEDAARQYRRAAKMHELAANDLMLRGWFNWAGESLVLADRLELAAEAESRDVP